MQRPGTSMPRASIPLHQSAMQRPGTAMPSAGGHLPGRAMMNGEGSLAMSMPLNGMHNTNPYHYYHSREKAALEKGQYMGATRMQPNPEEQKKKLYSGQEEGQKQ